MFVRHSLRWKLVRVFAPCYKKLGITRFSSERDSYSGSTPPCQGGGESSILLSRSRYFRFLSRFLYFDVEFARCFPAAFPRHPPRQEGNSYCPRPIGWVMLPRQLPGLHRGLDPARLTKSTPTGTSELSRMA